MNISTAIRKSFSSSPLVGLGVTLSFGLLTGPLAAVTIDYGLLSIDPSQIVDNEYNSALFLGLTISGVNTGGGPDVVAVYDTRGGSPGNEDPDLEAPWVGGNAVDHPTGNVLIIQENGTYDEDDEFLTDNPDDEAGGGIITFDWDGYMIQSISWYAPDGEVEGESDSLVRFYDGNVLLLETSYKELAIRDETIVWGDSTLNYIKPFTVAEVGGQWDRVQWEFLGSGALGVVTYEGVTEAPEPSTLLLMVSGLAGVLWRRRRT